MSSPKGWGYANLCDDCDVRRYEAKHVGVMIADGKTDYGIQLVRNPTKNQAEKIRSLGLAHDPRTQLIFLWAKTRDWRKVQHSKTKVKVLKVA